MKGITSLLILCGTTDTFKIDDDIFIVVIKNKDDCQINAKKALLWLKY